MLVNIFINLNQSLSLVPEISLFDEYRKLIIYVCSTVAGLLTLTTLNSRTMNPTLESELLYFLKRRTLYPTLESGFLFFLER